jgi:hypothetical protein
MDFSNHQTNLARYLFEYNAISVSKFKPMVFIICMWADNLFCKCESMSLLNSTVTYYSTVIAFKKLQIRNLWQSRFVVRGFHQPPDKFGMLYNVISVSKQLRLTTIYNKHIKWSKNILFHETSPVIIVKRENLSWMRICDTLMVATSPNLKICQLIS